MDDGPIREAASVVVGRSASEGIDVLVLERSASSRFLPGYVAFPGGATDGTDAELAARWFGSPGEAARACAVRELAEEVGLALTGSGLAPTDGELTSLIAEDPPSPDRLHPLAHWIAPERVPVRFDARYFAVAADGDDLEPRPDGVETARAWWVSPNRLLEAWSSGERKLYWPTYFTVRALAGCRTVEELLGLWIETREPDEDELERLPRSTFWQD